MTPKEKAKELVYDNYSIITEMPLDFIYRLVTLPKGGTNDYKLSKKMALKTVVEIIKARPTIIKSNTIVFNSEYWKNVKYEIENI